MHIEDSARLRFRLLSSEDAELLHRLDQDPEVMRFINGGKPSSEADIQQRMLPRMQAYRDLARGYGIYAVFAKERLPSRSNEPIAAGSYLGWVLVRPMNFFTSGAEHTNLELGWRFFQCYWRLGFASEAAAAIADSVVQQRAAHLDLPPVQWLSAIADPANTGSIAVMQKLGMHYVKHYLHQDPLGDFSVVLYQKPV